MTSLGKTMLAALAAAQLGAGFALAADPVSPVRRLMDIETARVPGDIFGDRELDTYYSQSFAETYRIARKVYEMSGTDIFLEADPVTGIQDTCPLTDIAYRTLAKDPEKPAVQPVEVRFSVSTCYPEWKGSPPIVRVFYIASKAGKPVIDDLLIDPEGQDGKPLTLKGLLLSFTEETMNRVAYPPVEAE